MDTLSITVKWRACTAPTHFLVAPVVGREAELEAWLEENVDSPQVAVETFNASYPFARDAERDFFLFYAVAEAIAVASAGTIAWLLARLDPVSITERR